MDSSSPQCQIDLLEWGDRRKDLCEAIWWIHCGGQRRLYSTIKEGIIWLEVSSKGLVFKLYECLIFLGFAKSNHEQALYLKKSDKEVLIIRVYVDDLLITSSNPECIENFKARVKEKFEMSDLRSRSSYMRLKIIQSNDFIFLSQKAFVLEILDHAKMEDCNLVSTPLEASSNEGSSRVDSTNFRSLIGSLRCLTHSRPDLLYYVGVLSRFIENLTSKHLNRVKWILKYVKGIVDYGLLYKRGGLNSELIGFSDSDLVGDAYDQKSTSGHIYFFGGMAISWSSQK